MHPIGKQRNPLMILNIIYGSHDILTFPTRDNSDYEENKARDNCNWSSVKRGVVISLHNNVEIALQCKDKNLHERTWVVIDLMPNNSIY